MKYDPTKIVFLDTETTGLYADQGHEVWDIAYISWNEKFQEWEETELHPDPYNLGRADPMALAINRFYERTDHRDWKWDKPNDVARHLARALAGKHLVGAIPSFDAIFLNFFMRSHGQCPTWHYHLIDIEAMCLGYITADKVGELELPLPWKSKWLSEQLMLDEAPEADKHTALGDARDVKRVWDYLTGS